MNNRLAVRRCSFPTSGFALWHSYNVVGQRNDEEESQAKIEVLSSINGVCMKV